MSRPSKRFTPTRFTRFLVPAALALLSIGLLLIIIAVGLAVAGLLPIG